MTLSYTNESPNEAIYQGTLTDSTDYDGTTIPLRESGAVFIKGYKLTHDSAVDSEVVINEFDAETATEFTFDVEKDGWYQFMYIFVETYDAGTAYAEGEVVHYDGLVYQALDATIGNLPTDTDYWELVDEPTELATSYSLVYDIIIYPFAKKLFGDLAEEYAISTDGTFKDVEQ